jgi:signal transduction histidine kinase
MRLRVRPKLVLLSGALLVVVSFGFTLLNLWLSHGWVEEDLKERAIAFAREIAVTIGDRRELESDALLNEQVRQILTIRQMVSQLDILALSDAGTAVVATSHPALRLPFTRQDLAVVRRGQVVSRLVEQGQERYWEILAPITLSDGVAGAVAAKFSLDRAGRLAKRTRAWTLGLTAVSVLVVCVLVSLAAHRVVDRPLRAFVETIARVRAGDTGARVQVEAQDEFGDLAEHFNEMVHRLGRFNDELGRRVTEATAELDRRYQEVERLNRLLFEMQRRVGAAERMAVSGRIMAEVAHEVGTPLHSIAGHLELLRQALPREVLAGDVARRLEVVEGQVARVTGIIGQLLDSTRRPTEPAGPVDLARLVQEVADLVQPGFAAAGVGLAVSTAPRLPAVWGHASQLQQVSLNLVTNALDATPPGGRVSVSTRASASGLEVVLEVTDTGHGIPDAHRKQMFDPFFSTKPPGQGTGLGLFVAARIVRDHKGELLVDSAEGRGSTFTMILPVAEGRPL